jgi:biopolymer transport protein ExbD
MGGGAQGDDDELITAINVTPLVDVVLVLLIILMVTASYIVSKSIPLDLPEGQTGENTTEDNRTLTISIDAEGQLFLDAEPIDRDALRSAVRQYREESENPRAVIAADGAVPHRSVVQVIDLLRGERVSRFAISVNPEDLRVAGEDDDED